VSEGGSVDNAVLSELRNLARQASLAVSEEALGKLAQYASELLRWNAKVNLTAITQPAEVAEKHLLDSLAVMAEVAGFRSLVDLGAGAGLPGIPLKIVYPELQVTLVDAVAKKVGFMKHAVASLGLAGAKALHARAEGNPEREGIPKADLVICRAFMDLGDWLALAPAYLADGGRILAMLGKPPEDPHGLARSQGLECVGLRGYRLPNSQAERHVAVFARA
jgi:16S rRNA (guanine527-N7)-methyltransferase